ncbi:RING-H2 finger protein ATL46-like [Andrographis paniculata]|uniref:RING-H2 finger protein ATL46-like n=1 Tax=Andrographis paniculata TaxID=175694 RepID=UPI0021E7B74E|nr:RING-H2 finger protein ATL46-like [Andrographis paniculata]
MSAFGIKISAATLTIMVVLLSLVFFIGVVLCVLLRLVMKMRSPQSSEYPEESTTSGALQVQRQLRHLFHMQDSGLDQAYIEALPVFLYKDIVGVGLKGAFDCAVCLCEFTEVDELRLLPLCSHAFHIGCIDTWLLSNTTCPLCREVIVSHGLSLESPFDYIGGRKEEERGSGSSGNAGPCEVKKKNGGEDNSAAIDGKRVFSVRLGKSKKSSDRGAHNAYGGGIVEAAGDSDSNLDGRRCYSMGSFQYYEVDDDSELQVAQCPCPTTSTSSRDTDGVGVGQTGSGSLTSKKYGYGYGGEMRTIGIAAKGESLSVSKIWLWSGKGEFYQ